MNPSAAAPTATAAELVAELSRRSDPDLVRLFTLRADLALPPPSSLTALAGRALTRPSVERALAGLDRRRLAVAEVLCALAPAGRTSAAALAEVLGLPPTLVAGVLAGLTEQALLVAGRPVLPLLEALGPYPAGFGPPLAPPPGAPHEGEVADLLAAAPPAARRVVDALAPGPPVGVAGTGPAAQGTAWLLERGLLAPVGENQVVLPLEVGLTARGGRSHDRDELDPPTPGITTRAAVGVAAEAARNGEEAVRLVAMLIHAWQQAPAARLRGGGLANRELRRAAELLDVSVTEAATLVECAWVAGLLAADPREDGGFGPAPEAAAWLTAPLGARWAQLVNPWPRSPRTPWLVGTRDERGALRAALAGDLERGWAPRLRQRVLELLAELPPGSAPDAAELHELLSWHAPRATAPATTIAAVLAETELLGITGAHALADTGRLLTAPPAPPAGADDEPADPPEVREAALAAGLESALPPPVGEVLLQGDLTGVVPGRPEPALAALLESCSDVESRGPGLTVRFSPDSVRRALDEGAGGEELLARLREHSPTPLPQALEYLVADASRRHGEVRVGAATSYVRTRDEVAARALLADERLAPARLRALTPTVLVSGLRATTLVQLVRDTGLTPLLEDDGADLLPGTRHAARVASRPHARATVRSSTPSGAELTELVTQLRAGEVAAARRAEQRAAQPAVSDPGHAVAVLREAVHARSLVRVVLVEPGGARRARRVRPMSIEGGRVRLVDVDRETELTVAVHHIRSVTPEGQ